MKILYEDNHLIAIHKPCGLLTQGDRSGTPSLMDEVKLYLKKKYNKPGNVFLGLVHRLDREVSGVVVFAKTSKGASRLSEQFRNKTTSKIYEAIVRGHPETKEQKLVHFLLKNAKKNKVSVYEQAIEGSKRAELVYTVIESNNAYSLLRIWLLTGRPHQIRAQLSHIGFPIVGDAKYGGEQNSSKCIMLRAVEFEFTTATQDIRKRIIAPHLALPASGI